MVATMDEPSTEPGSVALGAPDTTRFSLREDAPARIRAFYDLWVRLRAGGLPDGSAFDVATLSTDYPLLARIGVRRNDQRLIWLEVATAARWPFKMPAKGRAVLESVPSHSVTRVISAFHHTLSSGTPDYFETTSWMHGGSTLSLARLVVPVATRDGRELIALWEIMEPPSAL
jgi:hypothetical protein